MKIQCQNCTHFKNDVCAKSKKNGYGNCTTYRAIPIDVLTKEYKLLLVSKVDPDRLQFLKSKLEEINGGTI